MRCLTDVELQAVVDGEAAEAQGAHVAACPACRNRADARRRDVADLIRTMNAASDVPPALASRVRRAIVEGPTAGGATRLRGSMPARGPWRRTTWLSGLATAAAIAIVAFVVVPRVSGPTTLSAAQVLGRSLQTMTATHGIESLEYEVVVAGIGQGAYRIEQLIDHDQPTRFRVAAYGPDGVLQSAFSQDPQAQRRVQLVRGARRNYIVTVGAIPGPVLSLPQMMQALVETTITAMQATSNQNLIVHHGPSGPEYIVEIPAVGPRTPASPLELYRARAVVDGTDFRIKELESSGALLRQPFSVSFKLIQRRIRPAKDVAAAEFEIRPGPDDVVLQGAPSAEGPLDELLATLLGELDRVQGR